ncbi:hypothetical protein QD47_16395 [Paenibacillus terrae]|uniref:Uncharacterized protein n=1 Tax=Paenibacillus terrae TaxID=159743 RepID=A0A0D7WZH3_9BACL|nr:hypothetical protein QD47_16395 [Paenibacillus terrae]
MQLQGKGMCPKGSARRAFHGQTTGMIRAGWKCWSDNIGSTSISLMKCQRTTVKMVEMTIFSVVFLFYFRN